MHCFFFCRGRALTKAHAHALNAEDLEATSKDILIIILFAGVAVGSFQVSWL